MTQTVQSGLLKGVSASQYEELFRPIIGRVSPLPFMTSEQFMWYLDKYKICLEHDFKHCFMVEATPVI